MAESLTMMIWFSSFGANPLPHTTNAQRPEWERWGNGVRLLHRYANNNGLNWAS